MNSEQEGISYEIVYNYKDFFAALHYRLTRNTPWIGLVLVYIIIIAYLAHAFVLKSLLISAVSSFLFVYVLLLIFSLISYARFKEISGGKQTVRVSNDGITVSTFHKISVTIHKDLFRKVIFTNDVILVKVGLLSMCVILLPADLSLRQPVVEMFKKLAGQKP